jgi:hypothetical protein
MKIINHQFQQSDPVNHPSHYTSHPSGIECIQITEHYNFCVGNSIKYLGRQGLKTTGITDSKREQIQDCEKAIWYIQRHIQNLKGELYAESKKQNETVEKTGTCGQLSIGSETPRKEVQGCNGSPAHGQSFASPTNGDDVSKLWLYSGGNRTGYTNWLV